jgi:hypothetical protein
VPRRRVPASGRLVTTRSLSTLHSDRDSIQLRQFRHMMQEMVPAGYACKRAVGRCALIVHPAYRKTARSCVSSSML